MYWSFVIGHSSFVRHSDFVIRTLPTAAAEIEGFRPLAPFAEQVREQTVAKVRIVTVAAESFDPKKPTQLILYALPNGNSIEETIGCTEAQGRDWHYYIQHIGRDAPAARLTRTRTS